MGSDGTHIKNVNQITIKDPDSKQQIFSLTKTKYNIVEKMRSLKAKSIHAPEVVSAIDKDLKFDSHNLFVRGIEGTNINSKQIVFTAGANVFLNSSNGSIHLDSKEIYLNKIPLVKPSYQYVAKDTDLQYKLCVCYPNGVLYRVNLMRNIGVADPCRNFHSKFNPCG